MVPLYSIDHQGSRGHRWIQGPLLSSLLLGHKKPFPYAQKPYWEKKGGRAMKFDNVNILSKSAHLDSVISIIKI